MAKFSVTSDVFVADDPLDYESEFVGKDLSLRDAIGLMDGRADSANEWPVKSPRWFTNTEYRVYIHCGTVEERSLHMPESLTKATRLRIARLLGVCPKRNPAMQDCG